MKSWKLLMMSVLASATLLSACKKDDDDTGPTKEPTTLDCDYFSEDRTLTDDPEADVDYIISCQMNVTGVLTIEPGVVIHFEQDAGIECDDNGTIVAVGNAASPIVMNAIESAQVPGGWAGVYVSSNDVRNKLEYVEIYNAGGAGFNSNDDRGNVILYADGRLSISNCIINDSETDGLNVAYWDNKLEVMNSTFSGNNVPVLVPATAVHGLDKSNDFTGNSNDMIYVHDRTLEEEVMWQNLNVPYRMGAGGSSDEFAINSDAGLTIEAGTHFKFDADCGFAVSDGFLKAIGTSSEPIIFEGYTAAAGAWKGLFFNSPDLNNELDYCVIQHTGSGAFNSNGDIGAVILWADSYLKMSNSELSMSDANCAINAPYSGETFVESGNTYTGFVNNYCD